MRQTPDSHASDRSRAAMTGRVRARRSLSRKRVRSGPAAQPEEAQARRRGGDAASATGRAQRDARPAAGRAQDADGAVADRGSAPRADLYAEVTARIIAELEQGRLPWVQPWGDAGAPAPGLPRNALTGRAYSGVNVLILWTTVIARGWPSQNWLTFKQALDAGGHVRKGERGTAIVFADRFTPEAERERARETGEDAKAIPFLKRFTVFNVAQIDGLHARLAPEPQPLGPRETVDIGEALIAASGVTVRIGGAHAFYAPAQDIVQLPPQQAFFEQINFYRTAFHELTHATGHRDRLGRDQSGAFGSPAYAREELVAEIGAAFLCAALGICPTVRHADYIGSWLAVLRADLSDDPAVRGTGAPRGRAIFRAAAAASRAADWLLARLAQARADAPQGAAA